MDRHAILLAEDEELVRDLIALSLEREGHFVLVAADGRQALEMSRDYRGSIDLLITDIVMPQMDGIELSRHLQNERPEIRVLAISGKPAAEVMARDSGFVLLQKPFLPRDLKAKVREVLAAS
jgi:DNA-binding response OmpR family regulator